MARRNLTEIVMNMYRELYAKSTPPADFDQLIEEAEVDKSGKKIIRYMDYHIDKDVYDSIVNRYVEGNNLTKSEKKALTFEAYLGCGPSTRWPKNDDEKVLLGENDDDGDDD